MQHAHDLHRLAVDRYRSTDDTGIRCEHPPPEAVADDGDRRRIGHGLFRAECPAESRQRPEYFQRPGRHGRRGHALRITRRSRDVDGIRGHRRERHRAALLGVVEVLGVRQRGSSAPVPPVPDCDETLGVTIRKRTQQHRVHDAEDSRVGADPERERHDGDRDDADVSPHAAEGVVDVLAKLIQMFTRTDGQKVAHSFSPHTQRSGRPTRRCLAPLLAKDVFHLPAVIRPHVERQQCQQPVEPAISTHVRRALGINFFARAIPRAVSIRCASARATRRPKSVSR